LGSDSSVCSIIDFIVASGAKAQDQYDLITLDPVDDAYITGPDPAMTGQSATQGVADLVGFTFGDPLSNHFKDPPCLCRA